MNNKILHANKDNSWSKICTLPYSSETVLKQMIECVL